MNSDDKHGRTHLDAGRINVKNFIEPHSNNVRGDACRGYEPMNHTRASYQS